MLGRRPPAKYDKTKGIDRLGGWDNVLLNISRQETYDKIISLIENETSFSIDYDETIQYKRIVAYGGRGASKKAKAAAGIVSFGVLAAANHYMSKKRYIRFYLREAIENQTTVNSSAEGYYGENDMKLADAFNKIHDELEEYIIEQTAALDLTELKNKYALGKITKEEYDQARSTNNDPLKILNTRYARGEITKEEYDAIKKDLV